MKQPELGKKISELRKAKGLTQEELVEKSCITIILLFSAWIYNYWRAL